MMVEARAKEAESYRVDAERYAAELLEKERKGRQKLLDLDADQKKQRVVFY